MPTRRSFLKVSGLAFAGLALPRLSGAAAVVEIRMKSDPLGTKVWFDPIGVHLEPGRTVRWVVEQNVHTTTAYHPTNDQHSLRIPEAAIPWDSRYLVRPGDHFEVILTVEGVYDYFCMPHELAGMVGRIVVGRPSGPGTLPFDYFKGRPWTEGWRPVPEAARKVFPSVSAIIERRIIRMS
jgi:plastocyanin